jgi:hypothetical protein
MADHIKQPQATFEVVFVGRGIAPERIPIRTLSETMEAVQALANGNDVDSKEEKKSASIGLVKITRGSAGFHCVAPRASIAMEHLRLAGLLLARDSVLTEVTQEYVLRPIETLSRIAGALKCRILVCPPRLRDAPIAVVDSDSYGHVSTGVFVQGDSSVSGRIQRVGGATEMRCTLRVPDRESLLYCDVSNTETARKLGQHLYQNIVATGVATWFSRSWRLYAFKINDIYQPKEQSVVKAFEELSDAGGNVWADVEDPETLLRDFRS